MKGFFGIVLVIFAGCSTAPPVPPPEVENPPLPILQEAEDLFLQGEAYRDNLLYEEAQGAFRGALQIFASLDHREGTIKAFLALGDAGHSLGFLREAFAHVKTAEVLARDIQDQRLIQKTVNLQAKFWLQQQEAAVALELLRDSLKEEDVPLGGTEQVAGLRLVGTALQILGEKEEARETLDEALALALVLEDKEEEVRIYYRLASLASSLNNYDEAAFYAAQALEGDKLAGYRPGVAVDLQALGLIFREAGDKEKAVDYFRRSWLAWWGLGQADEAYGLRKELEALTGEIYTDP